MSHSLGRSGSIPSPSASVVHWDESENMYPLDFLVEQIRQVSHSSERHQLKMRFDRGSHLLELVVSYLTRYSNTTGWTVTMCFSLMHVVVTIQTR